MSCGAIKFNGEICLNKVCGQSFQCVFHTLIFCDICQSQYRLIDKTKHFNNNKKHLFFIDIRNKYYDIENKCFHFI